MPTTDIRQTATEKIETLEKWIKKSKKRHYSAFVTRHFSKSELPSSYLISARAFPVALDAVFSGFS